MEKRSWEREIGARRATPPTFVSGSSKKWSASVACAETAAETERDASDDRYDCPSPPSDPSASECSWTLKDGTYRQYKRVMRERGNWEKNGGNGLDLIDGQGQRGIALGN